MELAILILSLAMLILSYLYAKTRRVAYNYAFILAALIKTQFMIAKDKADAIPK